MISLFKNSPRKHFNNHASSFNMNESKRASEFHKSFPIYSPTPLIDLKGLAEKLSVSKIWLKDESRRFNLNAFKVLGASYAAAKLLCEKFELDGSNLSFNIFQEPAIKQKIKNITFATATDGNHGRGVAWTAQQLGCKCVVYMPKGTTQSRFENIKSHGAGVTIIDGSYDEAVILAKKNSEKFNWILIQDTSWEGYEKIPLWIMQGYLTMMEEIFFQLKDEVPTHIFVQCGVGSLPAAVAAYCAERYNYNKPIFINVEPDDAACVFESIRNKNITSLTNEMKSIMAGLNCGTPSKIAFDILCAYGDYFIKCDDEITKTGMRILGKCESGDEKIISGESGAVTTGLIYNLLSNDSNRELVNELNLNKNSRILLFSTEGDTDSDFYKSIINEIN